MRVERLLKIVIYMINHEWVTARELADRLDVSVRTIQRDMDAISTAGIPVYANAGANGGYGLLPEYRVGRTYVKKEDYQYIIMALKSLQSGYDNKQLEAVLEACIIPEKQDIEQNIYWDFGVGKENESVQQFNGILEKNMKEKLRVKIVYQNGSGYTSEKHIEPLALQYKWYAWYLFAYDVEKEDYRTYKVARITKLEETGAAGSIPRERLESRMKEYEQAYFATSVDIKVRSDLRNMNMLREYFPIAEIREEDGERCLMVLRVPSGERLWKALLLSMGDEVEVLEPEAFRQELISTAKSFLSNYDTQVS